MEPRPIKLRSDRSIAAHAYHGWTLAGVILDTESGQLTESYLIWELPEPVRRPSSEEIARFAQVSVIEDSFMIEGRGIVIVPGIPRELNLDLKHGDLIVIIKPHSEKAFTSEIKSIEMLSPPSPKGWPIQLSTGIAKEDVQPGSQVWMRRREPDQS